MFYLKYKQSFKDISGIAWTINILKNVDEAPIVEEITLASSPVEIEWEEVDKIEPVMSSSCTINLISDSDREFLDMYTIGYGRVRLDIYREKKLYWSGTIDPELYEEPYSTNNGYTVSLTFSDFGPLKYLKWNGSKVIQLTDILDQCILAAHLNDALSISEYKDLISLDAPHRNLFFNKIKISGENFYDEDGEPMTLRDVLDESLKFLGVQLRQIGGELVIYDTNALSQLPATTLNWYGTDATLSFDKIYNNVKLTYSPYITKTLISGELEYGNFKMPIVNNPKTGNAIITAIGKVSWQSHSSITSFKWGMLADSEVKSAKGSIKLIDEHCLFGLIQAEFNGNNEACVALRFDGKNVGVLPDKYIDIDKDAYDIVSLFQLNNTPYIFSHPIAYKKEVTDWNYQVIGATGQDEDFGWVAIGSHMETAYKTMPYFLHLSLDVLFDDSIDPFDLDNKKGQNDLITSKANFVYVPIKFEILSASGAVVYHYVNSDLFKDAYTNWDDPTHDWSPRRGNWKKGAATWGDAWLSYYDQSDISKPGMRSWKTNRPMRNYYQKKIDPYAEKVGDGQLIPMPPIDGYLRVTVGSGAMKIDCNHGDCLMIVSSLGKNAIRWIAYRNLKMEILDKNGNDLNTDDVVHSAWLSESAKETLTIDTKIGSNPDGYNGHGIHPASRAQLRGTNYYHSQFFTKNGHKDSIEHLVIGSIYSNYASRKICLSGTIKLDKDFNSLTYKDAADTDLARKYMIVGDVHKIRTCSREIKAVEISKDDYQGLNYDD